MNDGSTPLQVINSYGSLLMEKLAIRNMSQFSPTRLYSLSCGGGNCGNMLVYTENARPHKGTLSQQFMARNAMAIALHPLYSLDLVPSYFFVFGHVKSLSRGESFKTVSTLFSAVDGIVAVPRKVEFDQGFSRVDDEARAMY
jgi:hypothetical protein